VTTAGGIVSLVVNVTAPPVFSGISQSGANVVVTGAGGTADATYYVVMSTNVALSPLSLWTPVVTNTFALDGRFTNSIPINPARPAEFFLLKLQ
jgi:hypothetical protein